MMEAAWNNDTNETNVENWYYDEVMKLQQEENMAIVKTLPEFKRYEAALTELPPKIRADFEQEIQADLVIDQWQIDRISDAMNNATALWIVITPDVQLLRANMIAFSDEIDDDSRATSIKKLPIFDWIDDKKIKAILTWKDPISMEWDISNKTEQSDLDSTKNTTSAVVHVEHWNSSITAVADSTKTSTSDSEGKQTDVYVQAQSWEITIDWKHSSSKNVTGDLSESSSENSVVIQHENWYKARFLNTTESSYDAAWEVKTYTSQKEYGVWNLSKIAQSRVDAMRNK